MAHRYKVYGAETGTTYRYFFAYSRHVTRPENQGRGGDYIFVVTPDQLAPFVLRVFISQRAQHAWRKAQGRELDGNEMYAAAKMRLFRAFDELESLREAALSLLVDEGNIEDLLSPLDL